MTKNRIILISSLLFSTFNILNFANAVVIDDLKVSEKLYPRGFETGFQNNLNFYLDGVGVDSKVKVPYDTILIEKDKIIPQFYTNTTEIGLYLNVLTESAKAGNKKAIKRIQETLVTMEKTPKWKGLFFWPYEIKGDELVPNSTGIVPAVDNGNFAFALAAVAGAFINSKDPDEQNIVKRIEAILLEQREGWLALYDKNKGMLLASWSTKKQATSEYYIDRKANESRLAAIWAILCTKNMGANRIPESVFNKMELYTQSYKIGGHALDPVLTWDGAYFQVMMPQIWVNEKKYIPNYKMVEDHTSMQKIYAMENNIPMVSSSATVDNKYNAFGVPALSESKVRLNNLVEDGHTGTPHAIALSYMVDPDDAIKLLRKLKQRHPKIESPYGWYDAIDNKGNITQKIISLDVGMFVTSMMAKNINADVETYLKTKGYLEELKNLYKGFIPNNNQQ